MSAKYIQHNNCVTGTTVQPITMAKVLVLFCKIKSNKAVNNKPSFRVPNSIKGSSYSLVIRFHGDDPLTQSFSSSGRCFDLIRIKLGV